MSGYEFAKGLAAGLLFWPAFFGLLTVYVYIRYRMETWRDPEDKS